MPGASKWNRLRLEILARDAHICQYCGRLATTVDHIQPKGQGGSDLPANLLAACRECNVRKGWLKFQSLDEIKVFLANPSNRCYPPPFSLEENRDDDLYSPAEWKQIAKTRKRSPRIRVLV